MQAILQLAIDQNNLELLELLGYQGYVKDTTLAHIFAAGLEKVSKHYGFPPQTSLSQMIDVQAQKKLFEETKGSPNEKLILFTKTKKSKFLRSYCLEKGANPLIGLETAAEMGNLKYAKFFLEKGATTNKSFSICTNAAKHGHLEFLQWAVAQGCLLSAEACSEAARGGHLETLKFLHQNSCPWTRTLP